MTEQARAAVLFARTWWIAILSILGTTLAVVAILLAVPSLKRTSDFARQGKQARQRTVMIAPISCLNYRDQLRRGVITPEQFRFAVSKAAGFPGDCPLQP